jgi:chromosome segregation ATPase
MSVPQIAHDIQETSSTLTHIISLSTKISGFQDGPHLREEIQADVRKIMGQSQQLKAALARLHDQNAPGVEEYTSQFETLRARMQAELPGVISALKRASRDAEPDTRPTMTDPLLQNELNFQTDQISVLDDHVAEILQNMREVHELFTTALTEIQKQRHMIVGIDSTTTDAKEELEKGNELLESAAKQQKKSTACIVWIIVILLCVVMGVVLLLVFKVF